jgi:hypothetical protein
MRILYILLFIFCLISCSERLKFSNENIRDINIYAINPLGIIRDSTLLEDKKEINYLVKMLNKNRKEQLKFKPNYNLKINYKDSSIRIASNGNSISVFGGYKYELKANIDEVLKEYFLKNENLK